eukprot:1139485-Pelagomonas_calceolata.AAC.4
MSVLCTHVQWRAEDYLWCCVLRTTCGGECSSLGCLSLLGGVRCATQGRPRLMRLASFQSKIAKAGPAFASSAINQKTPYACTDEPSLLAQASIKLIAKPTGCKQAGHSPKYAKIQSQSLFSKAERAYPSKISQSVRTSNRKVYLAKANRMHPGRISDQARVPMGPPQNNCVCQAADVWPKLATLKYFKRGCCIAHACNSGWDAERSRDREREDFSKVLFSNVPKPQTNPSYASGGINLKPLLCETYSLHELAEVHHLMRYSGAS